MGELLHLPRVTAHRDAPVRRLPDRRDESRRPEPEPLWRVALGRQLRDERTAREQRIADVAERAGVSPQYLSEVERGRKEASSEILSALAGALDLTVRELTTRAAEQLSVARAAGPVLLAA